MAAPAPQILAENAFDVVIVGAGVAHRAPLPSAGHGL